MHVLITGGSGCIGRCVVDELLARDHDLTVFDLAEPHVDAVTFVEGDVTDAESVADAVDGVDLVVHMAALIRSEDTAALQRVNVGGTLDVLDAAVASDARVLYVSSKAVFGAIGGRHGHPEYVPLGPDAPRTPVIAYGISKFAAEQYCGLYAEEADLEVACLRFGGTYGPGQLEA
jgi:UDP-glucose 4-epimerase